MSLVTIEVPLFASLLNFSVEVEENLSYKVGENAKIWKISCKIMN